ARDEPACRQGDVRAAGRLHLSVHEDRVDRGPWSAACRGSGRGRHDNVADEQKRLAIVVGGGPAPGINGVISAATIRARLNGLDVIGIQQGFTWLMQGNTDHTVPLTIESVSSIHFEGGSVIGTARANPTKSR